MKVLRSIKSAKQRHRDCRVVKRKGRVYVINKTDPRFKARQGQFIRAILKLLVEPVIPIGAPAVITT